MPLTAALDSLLNGLFDYAGLFPPAALPMDAAVAQFARHLQHPRRALLARFIVPVTRLDEFAPLALAAKDPDTRWGLSLLAAPAPSLEDLSDSLHGQVSRLRRLMFEHGSHFDVQALELKLPELGERGELAGLLKETGELLGPLARPWFEMPNGITDPDLLLETLARYNDSFAGVPAAGLKLRCGGVKAEDFPAVETVARVLRGASDLGVPLKFTAGLHHPVRHYDEGVQARMHGFFNIILAAALARELNLGRTELEQVLFSEDPADFHFAPQSLGFRGWRLDPQTMAAARSTFATSIGSCSFEEPLADLAGLGLLSPETTTPAH
jgi:hypothetical protein